MYLQPACEEELAIITCSYAPDFSRCLRLCQSMDRWVPDNIAHHLVVPGRDLKLFQPLQNGRRSVVAVEDVVPGRFRPLPGTQRWWLSDSGWPVRGWVMQQITKLSANHVSSAELLLFADSDLQFLKPFDPQRIYRNGRLRLHRVPGDKNSGEHLRWHHCAARLLGEHPRYFGSDYIGQLISWRRSHLDALQRHLEYVHEQPWYRGVARSLRVSEYILYGAFVEAIVGLENSGHYACPDDICHCCWFADEAEALASGRTQLRSDAVGVLLQSNLGLNDDAERGILQRIQSSYPTCRRFVES